MKPRAGALVCACLAAAFILADGPWFGHPAGDYQSSAWAEETWKQEFEDICSKTQDTMALSLEELRALSERCEKLKPMIEKLEGPQRQVYLKRLKMCKDLIFFVLQSREKGQ